MQSQPADDHSTEWTSWPYDLSGEMPRRDPLAAGKLGLITREVSARARAQTGMLAVLQRTDGPLDVLSAWGAAPWDEHLPSSLPADGFVGRVLGSGRAAVEAIDPELDLDIDAHVPLTHAAAAPVRPPDGPLAALCVAFATPPPKRALTLWLLERYAGLAALSLHDRAVLDGLLAAAVIDGLTGCLNHAAIRSELRREIARGARHGRALSCCFIDLDHFKQINDDRGHLHGSRVLAEVAAVIRDGLRAEDGLGRYGGDEFLAVLPETDEPRAHALAERLRGRISDTSLDGERVRVDASIGIARWRPGETVDQMLAEADQALLEAKRAGGATIVAARNGAVPDADQGPRDVDAARGGAPWTGAR